VKKWSEEIAPSSSPSPSPLVAEILGGEREKEKISKEGERWMLDRIQQEVSYTTLNGRSISSIAAGALRIHHF